ncbi:MAG: DUF1538 domain-containing protein [Pseudomonadota bacterium]
MSADTPHPESGPPTRTPERLKLSTRDTVAVLWPYLKRHFGAQVQSIWFIVAYMIAFQVLILRLPIVYAVTISLGLFTVALGLMFFMEGLRLGLMPLGEIIGSVLPRAAGLPVILVFAFLLGVGATFAEPAIAVLKAAGSGLDPNDAPLLYSLLNQYAGQLVASVGVGVGLAVLLGVLRFFYAWPLKYLAVPAVGALLAISVVYSQVPELNDVLGLAWDCGAVTTGPVTVPLVLALGIGVCRVVSSGSGGGGHSGFGIVTLASLFPILAVLGLAGIHYVRGDYVNVAAATPVTEQTETAATTKPKRASDPVSVDDYAAFLETGRVPAGFNLVVTGGHTELVDGRILVSEPTLYIEHPYKRPFSVVDDKGWNHDLSMAQELRKAAMDAVRAIIPLCLFLYVVLRLLGQKLGADSDVGVGILFSVFGMGLFGLGIALGLTPLGSQLGSNVPLTFAEIVPWGGEFSEQALLGASAGKLLAVVFAFFLGYGATLAEPALNALGSTVERITAGAFRKKLLMQSVAFGVGCGISAGVVKMAFGIPLIKLLVPAYALVLVLTVRAPNHFVNFSWDSAGVTTGPITVPLVLAMGLGIGANVPGVSDGFGILALASVGPILTVLIVGLYTQKREQQEEDDARDDSAVAAAKEAMS